MRLLRGALVLVVVLVAAVWAFAKLTSDDSVTSQTFGDSLRTFQTASSSKVRLSRDGTRLAFVHDGTLEVVRIKDAAVLTRAGANVVDAAWMPDGAGVLIDEGPIPTGQVAVINQDGRVSGVARLKPTIAFGNGEGLVVNDTSTNAAAIAVTRDAIGGKEHTDLAIISLQSGAVRVYATPGSDESDPVFVDDKTVAVASLVPSTSNKHLTVVDLDTGVGTDFGVIYDGPFVTTPDDEIVVAHRAANAMIRLVAVNASTRRARQVAVLAPHRRPLAVDAHTTRVVVRIFGGAHGERIAVDAIT